MYNADGLSLSPCVCVGICDGARCAGAEGEEPALTCEAKRSDEEAGDGREGGGEDGACL